jgi:hypothetical protein
MSIRSRQGASRSKEERNQAQELGGALGEPQSGGAQGGEGAAVFGGELFLRGNAHDPAVPPHRDPASDVLRRGLVRSFPAQKVVHFGLPRQQGSRYRSSSTCCYRVAFDPAKATPLPTNEYLKVSCRE